MTISVNLSCKIVTATTVDVHTEDNNQISHAHMKDRHTTINAHYTKYKNQLMSYIINAQFIIYVSIVTVAV